MRFEINIKQSVANMKMKYLVQTITQRLSISAIAATLITSTPMWAEDVPSMNVSCLCYEASSKTYKAFMLIDDKSRPEYEALIVAGKIDLRKQDCYLQMTS